MNYWYTTYSIACIIASFESTMKEIARPIAYNKCNRLWECTQAITGYFIIGTIPFGILWFIRSWTYDPYSIPTRLKLQFMTILITWGLVLIALFVWMMISISGMFSYLKRMKQNGQMQLQLNHLVDKIYDTQFDFKSIKKRLKHEFYRLPIKEKEIKLLEEKFTKTFENDPVTCDPENPAECSYCYMKL